MIENRIYISVNSLPNTNIVFNILLNKIENSKLKNCEIHVIHDSMFNCTYKGKLNVIFKKGDDYSYEYPALRQIWLDSQESDFYGLYLHVLGASKTDKTQFLNSISRLEYMLYGLLDNLELCINHLNNGADIVGSLWYNHYKGNFFWFKSSYTKTLFDPYKLNVNRFNAEYWICIPFYKNDKFIQQLNVYTNNNVTYPKFKNLFYLPINSDSDFLPLKRLGCIPNLKDKTFTDNIEKYIESNVYFAFDEVTIKKDDYDRYKDSIQKYLNYDSIVNII